MATNKLLNKESLNGVFAEIKRELDNIPQNVSDLEDAEDYATKEYADARTIGNVTATVGVGGEVKQATVTKDGANVNIDFPDLQGPKGDPLTWDDLTEPQKASLKGDPGDNCIPLEGESPLAQVISNATDKAITPNAVKEALAAINEKAVKTWQKSELDAMTKYQAIDPSTGKVVSTSSAWGSHRIYATSYRGRKIRFVTGNSYKAVVTFLKSWVTTNNSPADFCNGISSVTTIEKNSVLDTIVPDDCTYIYVGSISQGSEVSPTSIVIYKEAKERLDALEAKDEEIVNSINELGNSLYISDVTYTSSQITALSSYWGIVGGNWATSMTNNNSRRIPISAYKGKEIEIVAGENGTRYAFMKSWPSSSGGSASSNYCDETTIYSIGANSKVRKTIPNDCVYLYVDNKSNGNVNVPTSVKVVSYISEKIKAQAPIIYLNANGSDDNDGLSISNPKATFAGAMNAGGSDMTIVLTSDITESINFGTWNGQKTHVKVRANKGVRRRIILGKMLTDLVAYPGYDDVYTWTPGTGESVPSGTRQWLWQHDLPDETTLIPSSERHPLQRGRRCRRLSTKLEPSESLSALLSSVTPRWVVDNGTLYVRVAAGSDVTENPIVVPSNEATAVSIGNYDVELLNIEAWYGRIYTGSGSYNFKAVDCAARYCTGSGAWQMDDSMCVHLERCEADSTTMLSTTTGDGFNIHPTAAEDINAKCGTHALVDCWAHDCRDDGYSDHGRSEGTIVGGLYEHNGKGGLLPSYGSHDTMCAVTTRSNYYGVYCAGDPGSGEGGVGTQVVCSGCVSIGNRYNYICGDASEGQQIRLILNGCMSRDARDYGFYASGYAEVVLRDCTDKGSAVIKGKSANAIITIDNGTIIS